MTDLIWLLPLLVAIAGAGFYGGWKAAAAHLEAAKVVRASAEAFSVNSHALAASLDKNEAALALLKDAVEESTKTSARHAAAVEESLRTLFEGFERAGFVRSNRAAPRQYGEQAAGE